VYCRQLTFLFVVVTVAVQCCSLASAESRQSGSFLNRHWPDAIAAQGQWNESFTGLERSLDPAACGSCHVTQYQDWQTTLHSKSMGPGIAGQLIDMVDQDPSSAAMCWSCHSPLAEQKRKVYEASNGWIDNVLFQPDLQKHGILCAACHVRNNRIFGPPRTTTPLLTGEVDEGLPHDGFIAQREFTQSEFCKGCHQFNETDFSLNGKLIENTFNEWQESSYAAAGVQCQDCHMPGRRHLWRGIHDKEMVQSGIDIQIDLAGSDYVAGDVVKAIITLTNSGTGHYFPTYLTPKVFVRGVLRDDEGKDLTDSQQEYVIGRESFDLMTEAYDTRIPPGEQINIRYEYQLPAENLQLFMQVVVDPDHWYRRFYRNYLHDGGGGSGRDLLIEALKESEQSSFSIYENTFVLNSNN
jgi:hypothetical protein